MDTLIRPQDKTNMSHSDPPVRTQKFNRLPVELIVEIFVCCLPLDPIHLPGPTFALPVLFPVEAHRHADTQAMDHFGHWSFTR